MKRIFQNLVEPVGIAYFNSEMSQNKCDKIDLKWVELCLVYTYLIRLDLPKRIFFTPKKVFLFGLELKNILLDWVPNPTKKD